MRLPFREPFLFELERASQWARPLTLRPTDVALPSKPPRLACGGFSGARSPRSGLLAFYTLSPPHQKNNTNLYKK